ncbi:tryptophan-rich sensory protein [Acidithiobacillus sp. MC6.1]|uniref:Sensory protein TspO n=1 Tax=Acidithiobacillus ferrivorans TaxID=160808 RepID=A0A1B9C1Y3_9PROT|nr:TspO/MBR family protein [Acidithiobacillus ferrivorans]MBN6739534.1 tryptophan-rich sensory protein [Acidithiobacillus sp. MC6.1]OCB03986.1 sensory protein TspO [Acidithiobacillus ferrivorans]
MINHFAVVALSSLALTLAVATAGSLFRPDDWYERLRKPAGTPPPWVFPVVWTILYILMALAAALVFISPAAPLRTAALILYGTQILANAAWSWLFFRLHKPLWALIDLLVLLGLVLTAIGVFVAINKIAALLLVPYGLWLFVALYLNWATYWLNRKFVE